MSFVFWGYLFVLTTYFESTGSISERKHQTNASLEKMNNLTCFECNTVSSGEECYNLTLHNSTKWHQKCNNDNKICMVKRYSYSTSSTANITSQIKLWYLERSCTNKCVNGCIMIGERTKLYACTTCCNTPLCNVNNECYSIHSCINFYIVIVSCIMLLNNVYKNIS